MPTYQISIQGESVDDDRSGEEVVSALTAALAAEGVDTRHISVTINQRRTYSVGSSVVTEEES